MNTFFFIYQPIAMKFCILIQCCLEMKILKKTKKTEYLIKILIKISLLITLIKSAPGATIFVSDI